jgi:hypothetical protein
MKLCTLIGYQKIVYKTPSIAKKWRIKSQPHHHPTSPCNCSLPTIYNPVATTLTRHQYNTMEAVREREVKPQQEKKKSFINRVRKSCKKDVVKEKESRAPASSNAANSKSVTRDGVPVISTGDDHKFKPSDVRQNKSHKVKKNGQKFATKSIILEQAPAAREAAFSGPPRYDWIDIVSQHRSPLRYLVLYPWRNKKKGTSSSIFGDGEI